MEQTDLKQLIIQLKAKICYLDGTRNHLECDNDYLKDQLKDIELVCQRLTNENESFKKEINNLKKYKLYVEKYKPTMASFLIDDNETFVLQNQNESDNESIGSSSTVQFEPRICTSMVDNANRDLRDNAKQMIIQQGEDDSCEILGSFISFGSSKTINLDDQRSNLHCANGTASIDCGKFKFDVVDIHPSVEIDNGVERDINSNPTNNSKMPLAEEECSIENSNGCESTASMEMEMEDANFEGFDVTEIISNNKKVNEIYLTQNGVKRYTCSYANCKMQCRDQGRLKVHMLVHAKKRQVKERKRRFLCQDEHCGLRFFEKQHLERHALIHSGQKPYKCSYRSCGKRFRQSSTLKTHMLVHAKQGSMKERERRFLCQKKDCGLRFFAKQHLERHALIHSGEKPYKCSYSNCGKRFRQSSSLKAHMRGHTKEKPFVCREKGCRKTFSYLSGLRYHVNKHTS